MADHCKRCMVPRAGHYFEKGKARECIHGEPVRDDQSMCHYMRANILEAALMREVCPEAFDQNGKMIPEKLFDAIDAKNAAMRGAMKQRGPVLVFENPQDAA